MLVNTVGGRLFGNCSCRLITQHSDTRLVDCVGLGDWEVTRVMTGKRAVLVGSRGRRVQVEYNLL